MGEASTGETKGSGREDTPDTTQGKWAALTFLVFPRALSEEQLILSIWKVGWKKFIHEGAGKKDKAGWQTAPKDNHSSNNPTNAHVQLLSPGTLEAALRGRCYCSQSRDVETEALRG